MCVITLIKYMYFIRISLFLSLTSMCLTTDVNTVAIIGAGVSGIAAAVKLIKHNITSIIILEAENRIGGRVYSVPVDNGFIDLGAESVHGEKGNIINDFVSGMNLLEGFGDNIQWFTSYGNLVDSELRNEIVDFIFKCEAQENITESTNVGTDFITRYNESIINKYKNDPEKLEMTKNAIHLAENYVNVYEGSYSWNDLAIPNNYVELEGDLYQYWKGTGYKIILDILMEKHTKTPVPVEEKLKLSAEVRSINYSNDTTITIKLSDGKQFKAKHVIFTPSLGVLKSGLIEFKPALSETKLEAIKRMGFGGSNKIVLYFDEPWWDPNVTSHSFLFSENDRTNLIKEFPKGPRKNNLSWLYYLESITPNKFSPNVLIVWFAGDLVQELEKTDESIVVDGIMYLIRKYMGKRYNITEPSNVMRFPWITNPHFRGTYSYETLDIFKSKEKYQDILAKPLFSKDDIPLILFAGEATHLHYYSTVHGAIETGFREAERLIKVYEKKT